MERKFGVHSEVGKLNTMMVCRPGLAPHRLTPGNCRDLLFDDVIWVDEAEKDHADFVAKMQRRGVEVLELHDLLAQTVADPQARGWLLDRRITPNRVGRVVAHVVRPRPNRRTPDQNPDALPGALLRATGNTGARSANQHGRSPASAGGGSNSLGEPAPSDGTTAKGAATDGHAAASPEAIGPDPAAPKPADPNSRR
jgi:hypothetical protein